MKEHLSTGPKGPKKNKIGECVRAAALAGSMLLPHNVAHSFEIEHGADFKTGIEKVYRRTHADDYESLGLLAVVPGTKLPTRTWAGSKKLGDTDGFDSVRSSRGKWRKLYGVSYSFALH